MKNFTMDDLKRLSDVQSEMCMSIYLPTELATATTDKQRLRLKNLLAQAEKAVQECGTQKKDLYEMIDKARRLMGSDEFWRRRSQGLAVFIAAEIFLFYRLPVPFEESLTVAGRFAIKPLMPLFMADGRFYTLALSQAEVRLFSCTRHDAVEIELTEVPDGIAETLQYDEKHYQLQFHTETSNVAGDRPAMFHGHGVGTDDSKEEILRYCRDIDRGLAKILSEPEIPLVLAGVDYLLPIFREVSSYRWVMKEVISGNPEELRAEELQEKALAIVRPALEEKQRAAEERYRELAGKGLTAAGVRAVVPAAAFGQVDTLFVALDERRPGKFDRQKNEVTVAAAAAEAAEDLLDLAVVETIRAGGSVFALDREAMPEEHAAAAAILRF
ncbi:MAG: hypothetical protein WAO07_01520 [Desulfobacterales bacterium]